MNTDNFTNVAELLPPHLKTRASVETPKGHRDEYTDAAAGGREGAALCVASTPATLDGKQSAVGSGQLVARFDAPPYTLHSLRFGTPGGAQSAVLLCGQARAAVMALRDRLSAPMGTAVEPDEVDALTALRRDLHVWSERLAELMRSIAKVGSADYADSAD